MGIFKFGIFLLFYPVFLCSPVRGGYWTKVEDYGSGRRTADDGAMLSYKYTLALLDTEAMRAKLGEIAGGNVKRSECGIELMLPGGESVVFLLETQSVMSPALASKYPEILEFEGWSLDGTKQVSLNYAPYNGFSAMVWLESGERVFVDPDDLGDLSRYRVYSSRDLKKDTSEAFAAHEVGCHGVLKADISMHPEGSAARRFLQKKMQRNRGLFHEESEDPFGGSERREIVYTLAISTTVGYSVTHGGSRANIMASVVEAISRASGVFKRELGLAFELADDTDDLFQLAGEDYGYYQLGNSLSTQLLEKNQEWTDDFLPGSYDLGHVFAASGGGLAYLGVPCTTIKARGGTATSGPITDAFSVDYLSHEIGHQLGADHVWNSEVCSSYGMSDDVSVEPGSGSTIMSYAGICGSDDFQSFADPYFNLASLLEMREIVWEYSDYGCGIEKSSTGNLPKIKANSECTIPVNTPFFLAAEEATGDVGRTLVYNWEQFDSSESANSLTNLAHPGPRFRSMTPGPQDWRIFPSWEIILADEPNMVNRWDLGEDLPNIETSMNFRVTVRDVFSAEATPDDLLTTGDQFGAFSWAQTTVHVEDTGALNGLEVSTDLGDTQKMIEGEKYNIAWNERATTTLATDLEVVIISVDGSSTFTTDDDPRHNWQGTDIWVPNTGNAEFTVPALEMCESVSQGTVFPVKIGLRSPGDSCFFFTVSKTTYDLECAGMTRKPTLPPSPTNEPTSFPTRLQTPAPTTPTAHPTHGSYPDQTDWHLGEDNESCDQVCAKVGGTCTIQPMRDLDTPLEFVHVLMAIGQGLYTEGEQCMDGFEYGDWDEDPSVTKGVCYLNTGKAGSQTNCWSKYSVSNRICCCGNNCPTALGGPPTPPTFQPTELPTSLPTLQPTKFPTSFPTFQPTAYPTNFPTKAPVDPCAGFDKCPAFNRRASACRKNAGCTYSRRKCKVKPSCEVTTDVPTLFPTAPVYPTNFPTQQPFDQCKGFDLCGQIGRNKKNCNRNAGCYFWKRKCRIMPDCKALIPTPYPTKFPNSLDF